MLIRFFGINWGLLPVFIGDISEIEIYQRESGQKLSGNVIGNKNCPEGWEAENAILGIRKCTLQCLVLVEKFDQRKGRADFYL